MRPADSIRGLIKRLQVEPDANMDRRVHDRITRALEKWEKTRRTSSADKRPSIGRIVMQSGITKLAVAAAIIVACSTGLILWQSTGSGIALADVLARIDQVTGYMYQVSSTLTRQQTTSKYTSTMQVSKEDGIKMIVTQADANSLSVKGRYRRAVGDESYLLWRLNSQININHRDKTYDRFIYDGVKVDFYREQYNDPHTIIKQMLNCKHTSLGQSVLDGITVEGFQITDIAYGDGFLGEAERLGEPQKVDVKLWVDVDTFLPVRLEEDIVTKGRGRMCQVSYDFRWNVIINSDDFKPHIPEDYRAPVGDIIVHPFDEENAIKGLRSSAETNGSYPVALTSRTSSEESKRRIAAAYEEASDEERTKMTNEILSRAAPRVFYEGLVAENKDPAYYGKSVTPKDADKVLLRWKVSDNEYRVIYGDLRAETVSPEKLAELEKTLPK